MRNVKAGHARPIVCLDAGHYGKYNRSPVVPAYYESEMNWKLHLLLKEELESYGIEVRRTRTNKAKDLELTARGKASKDSDLLLSVHSNAADDERVDRPEAIYLVDDKDSTIDEMSKELAVLLSETVAEVMGTKDEAKQYSRLSANDRDGDGKKDDDYYGVLFGAHQAGTAAVILEHSFHTNTRATNWLMDDGNLAKLAKAEAKVIAEYFDVAGGATSTTAPAVTAKPKKLYRVRKSWADAASQIGAYENLDNAKKACKEGFTVYDEEGKAVYTKEAAAQPSGAKLDPAKSFTKALAGKYRVTAKNGLNLRTGAGTNKKQLELMAYGSEVQCFGYHTSSWLYVISETGKTGFCSRAYLVKK